MTFPEFIEEIKFYLVNEFSHDQDRMKILPEGMPGQRVHLGYPRLHYRRVDLLGPPTRHHTRHARWVHGGDDPPPIFFQGWTDFFSPPRHFSHKAHRKLW